MFLHLKNFNHFKSFLTACTKQLILPQLLWTCLKWIRVLRRFWFHFKLVYCRIYFGRKRGKKQKSGCTRLYSAWRKWTSETHADSFGPYCSWFQQHHNQSWQTTSPRYKLASHQQGARIAFPWQGKDRGRLSLSRQRPPQTVSWTSYWSLQLFLLRSFPCSLIYLFLNLSLAQSFLTPKSVAQVSPQSGVIACSWGALRTF